MVMAVVMVVVMVGVMVVVVGCCQVLMVGIGGAGWRMQLV